MIKKRIIIPIILILAIALTSCASDRNDPNSTDIGNTPVENEDLTEDNHKSGDDSVLSDQEVNDDNSSIVGYGDIKLTPMEAFDKFQQKYPNIKVKKVELDTENGSYVYEVEGYDAKKEYEIKIHPINGNILQEDIDSDDDDNDEEVTKGHLEKIDSIVKQALEEAGSGVKLEEWTLKVKNGRPRLEVEIEGENTDDFERTYDAETGELIEIDD